MNHKQTQIGLLEPSKHTGTVRQLNPGCHFDLVSAFLFGSDLCLMTDHSGYMSTEYAWEGLVPVKSDVFSFGVLMLEIVCGKKNTGFYQTASLNLLGYVINKTSQSLFPILLLLPCPYAKIFNFFCVL